MRTAVVLFNLGGPERPEAVEPFLFNLFYDPAIISLPLPLRWLVAKLISKRRGPVAREVYEHLGGGSPLRANTEVQALALSTNLGVGGEYKCFIAMRYWHPRCFETVRAVAGYNPDQIVLLPLYPQFSSTTSGSSIKEWRREAEKVGLNVPIFPICCYPTNCGFVGAAADLISKGLSKLEGGSQPRVLFSAHGLPEKVVKNGDPYQHHVELSANSIVKALGVQGLDWRVCYQSRVGPLEWIKPYLEDELKIAGAEGRPVILFPIAFVSEHSETLVELDIEYKQKAKAFGVPAFVRVPTVGTHEIFINGLADCVRAAVEKRSVETNCAAGETVCPAQHTLCPLTAGEV